MSKVAELIKCLSCPAEADYVAHGIRDQEIYDEAYCEACWNRKDRPRPATEETTGG